LANHRNERVAVQLAPLARVQHIDSSPGPCGGAAGIGLIGAIWASMYRFGADMR
jgi:hypothetical protein